MDSPGLSVNNKYKGLELIGSGAFGQVYLATQISSGKRMVIKRIPKDEDTKRVENEIRAGIALTGVANVAQYYECFESKNSFWLVFEYIEGSDLYSLLQQSQFKPIQEKAVQRIMRQLVTTLQAIHSKGIAHKDIKLENIMYNINTKKVTFIDFGLCSFSIGRESQDYCGSREYSPPEVRSKRAFSPEKADVWSLGVTAYALLYGLFPFSQRDMQASVHPLPYFPIGRLSDNAIDFLRIMIQVEPNNRASLDQVAQHPWLAKKKGFFTKKF